MHNEAMDGRDQFERPAAEYGDPGDAYYTETDGVTADPADGPDIEDGLGTTEATDTDWSTVSTTIRHAVMQERFEPYDSAVAELAQGQAEAGAADPPGRVEWGTQVDIFTDDRHPGVVFKLPNQEIRRLGMAEYEMGKLIEGHVRGLSLPCLEQMTAYDATPDEQAMVCEFVEGDRIWDIPPDERGVITDEHLTELVNAFVIMQENGIACDVYSSTNFKHHAERGLTCLDYEYDPGQTLLEKVVGFADVTGLMDEAEDVPVLDCALRFRDICGQILGREAVQAIEDRWRYRGFTFEPLT